MRRMSVLCSCCVILATMLPAGESAAASKSSNVSTAWMDIAVSASWKHMDYPTKSMFNMEKQLSALTTQYILMSYVPNAAVPAEKFLADYVKNNPKLKASPPDTVTFGATKYWRTRYDYGGPQVMLCATVKSTMVTITLQGKDLEKDADVLAMLGSMKYKFK